MKRGHFVRFCRFLEFLVPKGIFKWIPINIIGFVPTNPRTSLTASNGGPCKLGPTSGMRQCLENGTRQGADEWLDIDHQDVQMCPRQQSEGDVTLDITDSNSRAGPREVDPKQHTSYQ